MKKIFLAFALLSIGLSTWADGLVHTYHFAAPTFSKHQGYDLIHFDQAMLTSRSGEPLIPYISISLLLPQGEEAISITIEKDGKTAIPGRFELFPTQPSRPLSAKDASVFQKNETIYKSAKPYPGDEKPHLSTHFMNGFGFAFASFSPVEYIPAEGQLFYYEKVTVTIKTKPTARAITQNKMLKTSSEIMAKVERLAQNPDIIKTYPTKQRGADDFEILVVTPQAYVSGFDQLKAMYLAKGDRMQIVTTEAINSSVQGQDLQEKIRNLIIQKYQDNQIETVILGGDVELVPYRGFYCYAQSGSGYSDNGIPADLYYAALDGNWNNNGNNLWGEVGEDDLLPEIGVGRLPFSNTTEQNNLISKSLKYQTQPVLGEFTKPLLAGEDLYDNPLTLGSDYLELLIGLRNDNGYTTNGIPPSYNIQKMYDENQYWSGSSLINAINQGKQYVHHVGHANQTYVAKLTNSDITNANFAQTNGVIHNYTIFHTHGCDCGSFDYNDCILERMVNIENFAVAVIGNSRYGWFNEGQSEGPSAHLHREMTDAIYHDKIAKLGLALSESKTMTAPWVNAPGQWEEGALRWNFYDLNILGDPALSVWSAEPRTTQVNYTPELVIGTSSTTANVTVSGFALPGAVCSILRDGQLIGRGITNNSGTAEIVFTSSITEIGSAQLIVSGYNCLTQALPITFIPATGAYIVYSSYVINDTNGGNGNGLPDVDETIRLNLELKNVGLEPVSSVSVAAISPNPYITFVINSFNTGTIGAGETVFLENALTLQINHGIPNQEMVMIQLDASDGNSSWQSSFGFPVNAPQFLIGNFSINDAAGNNNGLLDPGETIGFIARVSNIGSCTGSFDLKVESNSPWLNIENPLFTINSIAQGEMIEHSFLMTVNPTTPTGTVIPLQIKVLDGDYSVSEDYMLPVGLRIEGFESGNFGEYEWNHSGNANWTISMGGAFEGNFCAKSGTIGNNQQSNLWISLIVMGNDNVKFARKVSSEANYDFLKFSIDNNVVGSWSGEIGWEEMSYPITEGSHVLKWSYQKDVMVAQGSDCAWIDKVTFPGTTTVIDLGEKFSPMATSIAPNPNKGRFFLVTNTSLPLQVKVINSSGQIVAAFENVINSQSLDATNLGKGIYVVEVSDGQKTYRNKMIIN